MVTINKDQGIYVVPTNDGYSCLGFDVAIIKINKLAQWLKERGVCAKTHIERGSIETYDCYKALMKKAEEYCAKNKVRCNIDLDPQLIGFEGKKVEVIDKYGEKRRFRVGKSMGWMPIHLEIKPYNDDGGPATFGGPFEYVKVLN